MRTSIILVFTFLFYTCSSQEILEHPTHPKGVNSNDQYEAIPFYNEAVELYHHGEIELAKKSLHEAINTSFALVEAQLFLGQIYYEKGDLDSAMIYLNSGIDFEINQPAHYYFMLFEAGMKHELYDVVIHNLKHFKKYYKNVDHGKYDSSHVYSVDDYEFYQNSISLATDHNYWKRTGDHISTLPMDEDYELQLSEKFIYILSTEVEQKLERKAFEKEHKINLSSSSANEFRWISNGCVFQNKMENESNLSYWKKENDKTWTRLPESVNDGSWNGQFHYSPEHKLIYFTSDRNQNLDIFVMKFNPETGVFGKVEPLDRVNTDKDEQFPFLENDVFYFASNGLPGFGGFDLYYTPDHSIMNDVLYPSKWYNMGKPYNTGNDEVQILIDGNHRFVNRTNWKLENELIIYEYVEPKKSFDYEIKMTNTSSYR